MDLTALSGVPPASGEGIPRPKNVPEAAQQFEALLLGQLLKNAQPSEESADATSEPMWDLAAQQFAQVLSRNGGLGLAKLITGGLDRTP